MCAFTIPNEADAFHADQAEPDSQDVGILVAGIGGAGVVSGCGVTAQGSPDMTCAVAAGTIRNADGTTASVSAGNVTITAADATNPRIDLVVTDSAGTKSVTAGTAAANPAMPSVGSNIALAAVYVPATDTTIASNQITDKRVILQAPAILGTILDAKGDIIAASAADTAARLAVGANGTRPEAASGETTGIKWSYPPGYELDYVQITSSVNITATSEATPTTIITANAVIFDGTAVMIEFFDADWYDSTSSSLSLILLYEDGSSIGRIGQVRVAISTDHRIPVLCRRRMTPTAASHTYSVRASSTGGTAQADAGAGGSGVTMPAYLRITKV